MSSVWTKSLALSLGLMVTGARGEDMVWRSQPAPAKDNGQQTALQETPIAIATSARKESPPSAPAATLGRPVPIARSARDEQVQPAGYSKPIEPLAPMVRGQAPETIPHKPMPLGSGAALGSSAPASPIAGAPPVSSPTLFGWKRADDPVATSNPGGPIPLVPNASPPVGPVLIAPNGPPSLFASGPGAACGMGDCTCGPVGCGIDGCCGVHNRWFVGVEYLLWWTKGDRTPPLVTSGDPLVNPRSGSIIEEPTTRILFGGHELGTGARSGIRVSAAYWFGDQHLWGLDLSGFIFDQQTNSFNTLSFGSPAIGRPIIDQSPIAGQIINGVPVVVPNARFGGENAEQVAFPGTLAGSIDVARTSRFWSGEANVRRNLINSCDWYLDFLVGYRMLGLDESLSITESLVAVGNQRAAAGTTFRINDRFATNNRFYGAQVGVDGEYRIGAWSLGAKVKVGLGDTQQIVDVSGNTRTTAPAPINQVFAGRGGLLALPGTNIGHYHRSLFSVVPEAAFTVGYQITPRLRATLGYNFLFWNTVARAGEQIDRNVNRTYQPFAGPAIGPVKPAFPFAGSDFWAQGLTAGLEYKW